MYVHDIECLNYKVVRFVKCLYLMWLWSVAGVYTCDVAEAVSTSRRAVCVLHHYDLKTEMLFEHRFGTSKHCRILLSQNDVEVMKMWLVIGIMFFFWFSTAKRSENSWKWFQNLAERFEVSICFDYICNCFDYGTVCDKTQICLGTMIWRLEMELKLWKDRVSQYGCDSVKYVSIILLFLHVYNQTWLR